MLLQCKHALFSRYQTHFLLLIFTLILGACGSSDKDKKDSTPASVTDTVSAPMISPNGGAISDDGVNVSITSATEGAAIYYTFDGSTPSASSQLYSDSFTITENSQLQAIAVLEGMNDSSITVANFSAESEAPSISSVPSQQTTAGGVIQFTVNTSDNEVPSLSATRLPANATFTDQDDGTARFQWTTQSSDTGEYNVIVTATDAVDTSLSTTIAVQLTVTEPDSPFQCNSEIRIMPLGDSHTKGKANANGNGPARSSYRPYLYRTLNQSGYNIDFVGSSAYYIEVGFNYDRDQEGHSNEKTAFINSNVSSYLSKNPADIVLLHVGTNDILFTGEEDSQTVINRAINNVESILNKIDSANTNTIVVLAKIMDQIDLSDNFDPAVRQYNTRLAALVSARTNDKLILVDMESAIGVNDFLKTETPALGNTYVHLTNPGYEKMAQEWNRGLRQILPNCSNATAALRSASVPAIGYSNVQNIELGNTLIRTPDVTGYPKPTFELVDAPEGMIINPETGTFHWHPSSKGTFTVIIKAGNSQGETTTQFTVTVN